MRQRRLIAIFLLVAGAALGYFLFLSETISSGFLARFKFKLGLDLQGGTHLVYQADTSRIDPVEVGESMASLRDVIERRVNLFGVSEPVVQVEQSSALASGKREQRLIVELPGVTNLDDAISLIGATPVLEFKTQKSLEEQKQIIEMLRQLQGVATSSDVVLTPANISLLYQDTGLTGRMLKKAVLQFDQTTGEPTVLLRFNEEGTKLFADITKATIGQILAIFLDGVPISEPTVNDEITTGEAVVSGNFNVQEARQLVGRLNSGALPVPISLLSTQKIGATLGETALDQGLHAGLYGFLILALFLIFWYRLPGLLAVLSLCLYIVIVLALFKLIPVVLTSAGIAGFILSVGMAVDANILIFERTKEELRKGLSIDKALHEGFSRAWPSIRDSNVSSILTALVLFWIGTSVVKGFALTFFIGVIVSMFTAITLTRTFLFALGVRDSSLAQFLFGHGLKK
jgi:protein-export membrane protein SecD